MSEIVTIGDAIKNDAKKFGAAIEKVASAVINDLPEAEAVTEGLVAVLAPSEAVVVQGAFNLAGTFFQALQNLDTAATQAAQANGLSVTFDQAAVNAGKALLADSETILRDLRIIK